MALVSQVRPSLLAVQVALAGSTGQTGRLCRAVVLFPDIGKSPMTEKLGFVPWAKPPKTSDQVR